MENSPGQDLLMFKVYVVPRASRSEIVGLREGMLRVRIAAPPVDGAANEELVRTLAKHFGVKARAVTIVSGQASRIKKISITGGKPEQLKFAQL